MTADASRSLLSDPSPPSLASLYREFGDRWDIEQIPAGTRWIAVLRESGGDDVRIIAARDVHALRFRMNAAEREAEREDGQP